MHGKWNASRTRYDGNHGGSDQASGRSIHLLGEEVCGQSCVGSEPGCKKHTDIANLDGDVRCVDFSGWTFFCHADLPNQIAYAMARSVDLCYQQIPVDHFDKQPMTMQEFCRGGDAGQLNIPLHPGAKRYYREKGYI